MAYCVHMKIGDAVVIARVCRPDPPPNCAWCPPDHPSTALCDGKRNGKPCNKPMCDEHRYRLDDKHDLCPVCRARWTGQPVIVNGVTIKP